MRGPLIVVAALAMSAAALAETVPERPETITVKDIFAEGGVKEIKPDWEEIDKHKLGSQGNPVRCDMPRGERLYLSRLRCPGGAAPKFNRDGSDGMSPYDAIMDIYTVTCPEADGMEPQTIYMDMYHPNYREKRPVPGFTIVPPIESVHPEAE